jgi:hypothetical protein
MGMIMRLHRGWGEGGGRWSEMKTETPPSSVEKTGGERI